MNETRPSPGRAAGLRAHHLAVVAALVMLVTLLGLPAHATYGARVSGDEPQYLLTARSLGRDGNLDISDEIANQEFRPFHHVDLDPQTYPLDLTGRQLSPHDPLLPAILAVPMRLGGWATAKATLAALAGALAALSVWVAVQRFAVRPGTAAAVVSAFACTAPLATYATQVYPEIPAALAVMGAVAALTGELRRRGLLVFALAITTLPWLSVKYLPVAAALFLVALWHLRHRRGAALGLTLALGALGVAYLVAHRQLYGGWTAYSSGDQFVGSGEFSVIGTSPNYVGRSRRLLGLLVDRGFGLAAWAPAWLIVPFALGALARRRPRGSAALAVPVAAGWFVATFIALTMHGWWWPGRQLVVILPLLVVAIAWVVDQVPAARVPLLAATVFGVVTWVWTTFEAITRRHVLIVDFEETGNPWYHVWRQLLPDGRTHTGADDVLLAAWWLVAIGLAVLGWRTSRFGGRPSKVGEPTYSTRLDLPAGVRQT
jgi:hypothetical protein